MIEDAGASSGVKTINLLKKKIAKTQSLMNDAEETDKKGRESKLYCRLAEKLEQYEAEMAELESAEDAPKQTKHKEAVSPATPVKSSTDGKQSISPWGTPVLSSINRHGSDVSALSSNSSETAASTLHELQKKLKKVQKLMTDMVHEEGESAKEKKLYKRYAEKLAEYETSLTEFEGRIKQQANDGKKVFPIVKSPKLSPKARSKALSPKAKSKAQLQALQPDYSESLKFDEKTAKNAPKKKTSSRSSGPKKKTTRVSATRIKELNNEFKPSVHEKDRAAEELIRKELKTNFIFQKLNERSVEEMVKAFEPTSTYAPGELIIEQGEETTPIYFYIIRSGEVDFEVNGNKVGSAESGKSFGEQGLLYSCPRKASVRAASPTQLFRVDQITFRYVLQNQTKFHAVWKQATRKVMAMNRLMGAATLKKMLEEDGDGDDNADDKKYDLDNDFQREDSFNLGAHEDKEEECVGKMMSQMSSRRTSMQHSFLHETRLSLASFNRQSVLGEGQYGEVWKVTPKIEELKDQNFALKIQAKEDVMREASGMTISVAEAIERECEILSKFCHPFICEFVHKFEDDHHIYLLMGVIRGVELWNVLHREGDDGEWESGIPEENAKFYGALIADTLRYMHRQKICYRDLKPENVMIDETGYPVLVDFGFAKHIPDGQTFTFCGTPNYTCPEIISNEGHGFPVDWWAFGVVVYEMVSGENPFYYDGISDMQLLEDITHNDPEPLAEDFSDEVKDLISKLLIKDPQRRLGSVNMSDILNHPWFESIDLPKGRDKLLDAPFFPPVPDDDE